MEPKVKFHKDQELIIIEVPKRVVYEIPINRCRDAAQVMNWIFQVKDKNWCTHKLMFDLLSAFQDAGVAYR
jgi:hypothetical protein